VAVAEVVPAKILAEEAATNALRVKPLATSRRLIFPIILSTRLFVLLTFFGAIGGLTAWQLERIVHLFEPHELAPLMGSVRIPLD
jgi:hypothetical protein